MSKRYIRVSDGALVSDSEALIDGRILRDGYHMTLAVGFMDSKPAATPMMLRDAAGQPVTLHDERTGGTLKLNADLITAIEAEAAKLNMSVHEYVQHVLKYSFASANLSGNGNTGSPAKKETI